MPAWQIAAGAGEDYELCVCIDPADRERAESALAEVGGAGITWVGRVERAGGEAAQGTSGAARARGEAAQGTSGAARAGVALLDEEGRVQRLEGFEHRW